MRYNKLKMIGDMIMKEKTACFTGHRDIPQSELKQISKALKKAICEAYENGYISAKRKAHAVNTKPF